MSVLQIGGRKIREIMPEMDVLFAVEWEQIGRHPSTLKRSAMARELFLWAFEQYKRAGGSMRRLLSARVVFDDETPAISDAELWDPGGGTGGQK